jgi:uncharacterized RDD family membrane protein YckC
MGFVKVNTAFNVTLSFELAGIDRRFFAWIIDFAIQMVYWIIMYRIAVGMFRTGAVSSETAYIFYIIITLPVLFYHLLQEIFFDGQSIGKRALSIKVLSLNGYKPTLSQYLNRWMFRLIDVNPFIFGLISLYIAFNSKKEQRVGDIVGGTVVVKTKPRTQLYETVYAKTEDTHRVTFPQVMKLSDRDMSIIKSALIGAQRTGHHEGLWRITAKVKTVLEIKEDITDPAYFLATLIMDYNHLSAR